MNAQTLSLVAGTILSLAFSYVPGLRERWEPQKPVHKRLIMLGLLLIASAGSFGLACWSWAMVPGLAVTCDRAGVWGLLEVTILAIIANQSVYQISPQSQKTAIAK